jgi:DNA-binding MarR family transcriptional regulator
MADSTSSPGADYGLARLRVAASPLFLRAAEVRRGVDLLLLGHAHLLRAVDPLLREAGLGRAHFRALGHVARWPGLAMGDLIDLTGTSKQALTRVARELEEKGLIVTTPGARDRRRRELRATDAGRALVERFDAALIAAMADAYAGAGQDAVTGYWQVLEGLVPVATRIRMAEWEKGR